MRKRPTDLNVTLPIIHSNTSIDNKLNFSVILTDIEQLYPEQYPIGYYDRYNINHMANNDKKAVEQPRAPPADMSAILRSIIFNPDFRLRKQNPL